MERRRTIAAVCQLNSGPDRARNIQRALELVSLAASRGAAFIALPENFELMASAAEKRAQADAIDGETLRPLRELVARLGVTLVAGSFAERSTGPDKVHNTSVLFGPDGARLAVYRKIHLFDVEVGDGAIYRESELVAAGDAAVTSPTTAGRVGLSICYDLRFPELYRQLSRVGAEILCVPSAFTLLTGKDHWEPLLRARAIENQCYVVAPAQWGSHPGGRVTYGHSLIVDPWGTVLCCHPDGEGVALAELDLAALDRIRLSLPALRHRRL